MGFGDNIEKIDIFLDLENAVPKEEAEKEIYNQVSAVLTKGPAILEKLSGYSGCEDFIRKAITTPGPENEDAAWGAVVPAVEQLREFYDFSLELDTCFPKLLVALCKTNPKENIGSQQALAKQLADVFDFVLRFDDLKMVNPAIQNDFSYYRRTLNRKKITKTDVNITIRDELANKMSLFFAYPTPMMNFINDTTVKFLSQDSSVPRDNVTIALALMANVCQEMVSQKKFLNETTNLFCLRAMTGSVIVFDHLHASGAFSRKSPINIKGVITALKTFPAAAGSGITDGLLNALRFSTIHLNDPDTPEIIKKLLE